MKSLTLVLLVCALGAAPAPLLVGSVRDQLGAPIVGAVIRSGDVQTTTANDGTFALSGLAGDTLHIQCAYCTPLDLRVVPLQPVVAIVQRYQALVAVGPSERDLAALPYERSESALGLAPFTVLTNSRALLPGPRLSYLNASPQGSAVTDDGFVSYDPVANVSLFPTVPFFDVRHATLTPPGESFYYGDQAGAGVVALDDLGTQRSNQYAITGSSTAIGSAQASKNALSSAAASATPSDARVRGALKVQSYGGSDLVDLAIFGAQSTQARGTASIFNSIEAANAGFERYGDTVIAADVTTDRAGYTTSFGPSPLRARWSDVAASLRAESQRQIHTFGDLGFASTTGDYGVSTLHLAGSIAQAHVDAGVEEQNTQYALRAGVGAYTIGYTGGNSGVATPLHAQALSSFLSGTYHLSSQWSASLYAGSSFRLPSLLETFAHTPETNALRVDRYDQLTSSLSYTDLHRLRVDLIAMNEQLRDLDSGTVSSAGISLSWQIAPLLVFRAWTLHFDDATQPYETLLRFGRNAASASPGLAWLTYENDSGLRFDVLYRSDLLDALPRRHLDASLSAPFEQNLRWFVGTEGRYDGRTVDAGIRFESP